MIKYCSKCDSDLPVSAFSKCKSAKDGLQGSCKSCRKLIQQDYQQTSEGREVFRKGKLKYRENPKTNIKEKKYAREYCRLPTTKAARRDLQTSEEYKEYKREYEKRPDVRIKQNARMAVRRAVIKGDIIKPEHCEKCNNTERLEGHHYNGYDDEHKLEVIFLCVDCHKKEHYEHN